MAEQKNWYLICYDISCPKRWRKSYQLLQGYGETMQYSIFRCFLSMRQREKLRWQLEEILTAEDRLLLVGVCDHCLDRVHKCNRPNSWVIQEGNHQIL
jgi:CRISPR-associated protein Cas2